MAKKPPVCPNCRNEIVERGRCPYCGDSLVMLEGTVICDAARKDTRICHGVLTTRYIVLRAETQGEAVGDAVAGSFGLIGSLIQVGIDSKKQYPFGFIDLREVQKVVYPFYNAKLKKPYWVRIVMKDGSDLILGLDKRTAPELAAKLPTLGVYVENGENQNAGTVYCSKPFINTQSLGLRVAASAAQFVKPLQGQYAAPLIDGMPQR